MKAGSLISFVLTTRFILRELHAGVDSQTINKEAKCTLGFPDDSVVKNRSANTGDVDSIPGSGRSPAEGNGNPLQDSCLRNPVDRAAWRATVHGVAKSQTRLND